MYDLDYLEEFRPFKIEDSYSFIKKTLGSNN